MKTIFVRIKQMPEPDHEIRLEYTTAKRLGRTEFAWMPKASDLAEGATVETVAQRLAERLNDLLFSPLFMARAKSDLVILTIADDSLIFYGMYHGRREGSEAYIEVSE